MENEIIITEEPKLVSVVDIQFRPGQKVYFFDPADLDLKTGDHVIMDTARGPEFGICTSGIQTVAASEGVLPLRSVLRLATPGDERIVRDNRAKEQKAFDICHRKIGEMGLDMQLVSVECAFDGSKLLFFFTAEERVDFLELVKNLASTFHTRIELRQIGVRDKAKMVGGLGICGRPFCGTSFLEDFQPVSIKMAKTQNLSLNPTKISGTCGRLMCCLKYEQDSYEYLLSRCPKDDSFVDTPEGRGTVTEVNLLRQTVKVRMEDDPETVSSFSVEEIAVLRNGKAKKNDPPIPADLAPIYCSGKRPRQEEPKDEPVRLDPIRFRYSTEAVVEETAEEDVTEETVEEAKEGKSRSRRRKKPKTEGQKQESAPKAAEPQKEKKEQPKKETPQKEQPPKEETAAENTEGSENAHKKSRNRNHYRRHRNPKPQNEG